MSGHSIRVQAFFNYSSDALSNFPTAAEAFDKLKTVGPPSVLTLNVSHPSRRVDTACQAITSLACYMQTDLDATSYGMTTHWETSVSKWVVFFLRNAIIFFQDPSTLEIGPNVLEYFLFALPNLLNYNNESVAMRSLRNRALPYLHPLIAQIWPFLIDEGSESEHPLTNSWSTLLISCTINREEPQPPPSSVSPRNHSLLPSITPRSLDGIVLGKKILAVLNLRIERVAIKNAGAASEIEDLKTMVLILIMGSDALQYDSDQTANPIYIGGENYIAALRSMSRIVSILLRKRTNIHRQHIESAVLKDAYTTVSAILLAFVTDGLGIDTPGRVQAVIESGIVQSLYYAADCFYDLSEKQVGPAKFVFVDLAASVLDRICTFIVHHDVLRAFMRSTSGLWTFGEEDITPIRAKGSEKLRSAWDNVRGKSMMADSIRWVLKQRGICDSLQCPAQRSYGEHNLDIQYLRCTGCFNKIYCSLECRKAHWKQHHKVDCARHARNISDDILEISRNDLKLFRILVEHYLRAYGGIINTRVNEFRHSRPSFEGLRNVRNPILYINYVRRDLPGPENMAILDCVRERSGREYKGGREYLASLQKKWDESGLEKLVVWAAFPLQSGVSTKSVTKTVHFPVEGYDEIGSR
ncbi:hypothetical protein AAF712_009212 [Marasmius tenuissimus]|uniref:MYND-type domain-containing protein n=1 Tax=Marasmius tenuissimus TaxID=585030 RepID=A0ABR2ZRR7_9AGAR